MFQILMSALSAIIWLILSLGFHSQMTPFIVGRIIDSESGDSLPYAHVYLKSSPNIGTTSNSEGIFIISTRFMNTSDTLVFSYVGYETQYYHISNFDSDTLKILLKRSITILNEVVITDLSAKEIVLKAIDKAFRMNSNRGILNCGYYRTASSENGIFRRLFEAFACINDSLKVDYADVKRSKDFRKFPRIEPNQLEDGLNFDHIAKFRGFLNSDNVDDWNYEIINYTHNGNDFVYIIEASYAASNELNHKGKIFITDDFVIIKIEYDYSWLPKFKSVWFPDSISMTPYKWKGIFNYAITDDKYYLTYLNFRNESWLLDHEHRKVIAKLEVYDEFISNYIKDKKDLNQEINPKDIFQEYEFVPAPGTSFYKRVENDLDSLKKAKNND